MRLQSTFPELELIAQRMGAKPSLVDQMINEVDVMGYGSSSANVNGNQTVVIDYMGKKVTENSWTRKGRPECSWWLTLWTSETEYQELKITEDHARTLLGGK
jgi:hypothetical protein